MYNTDMRKLDEIALNIELVLISIIEGVALATLGGAAAIVIRAPFDLVAFVFILDGLLMLLVFWSQAILHTVSFIRWPLRMEHMLLYFLAAFVQVIAYNNLTDPLMWFFWWTVFSFIVLTTYLVDLKLIREAFASFSLAPGGTEHMSEVLRRHSYELKFLVPLSVAFNIAALGALYIFHNPLLPLILGVLQFVISFGALVDCVRNFKTRSTMMPRLFEE